MATTQQTKAAVPTRDELIGRAAALVPALRERAARAEEQRRISSETIAEIQSAGLLRLASPDPYGGFGLDCDTAFEVEAELGRGCGSTAWCYGVWAIHNWATGLFPEEAQEEYYADPDVLSSSSYYPTDAHVTPVEGGYQISGRWSFSSGCDAAGWVTLGGLGPAGLLWFLVPASDYRIDDTWYVAGLKGTGSKDIVIEGAFVPGHRVLQVATAIEGKTEGWGLHHRPSYRVPLFSALSWAIAAPTIGMAQGALEEFTSQLGGRSQAESAASQLRLAESAIEIDLARMLMRTDTRDVLDRGASGAPFTLLDRARFRRDEAFVARLCVRATDRLYEAAGGHALYSSNPLQRYQRDIHAAAHHVSMRWDTSAELYGRMAMGLEPPPGARL